jgi:acetyl-CoA carboxylase biotin carboxyl carrier protein
MEVMSSILWGSVGDSVSRRTRCRDAEAEVNSCPGLQITLDKRRSLNVIWGPQSTGTSTEKEGLDVSEVNAPMAGKVIDVKVKVGDAVNENDEVVILEAMKMELPIVATGSGTVKEIRCKKGDPVEADAVLIVLG